MTLLEQPQLDGNGRKKGYIRIMSELWDAKGYRDLGLSSQNLRDQAARLENNLNLSWEAQTDANLRVLAQRSVYGCKNRRKLDRLYFFAHKYRFILEETRSESQYMPIC